MRKVDFKVFYTKNEHFSDFIMGTQTPDPKNLEKTHTYLKTHRLEKGAQSLSQVFHYMQGDQWSPKGEARPLIEEKGLGHTSMSVGDVIVTEGFAYMVDLIGFKELGRVE